MMMSHHHLKTSTVHRETDLLLLSHQRRGMSYFCEAPFRLGPTFPQDGRIAQVHMMGGSRHICRVTTSEAAARF